MNEHNTPELELFRQFEDNIVFGRKVPHNIFNEEKSNRVTQLTKLVELDMDRKLKVVDSKFRNLILKAQEKQNVQNHYRVLSHLLEHCETALAIEVPVWKFNSNHKHTVGHIDLIMYEHPFFHILDYKPKAFDTDAYNQVMSYRTLFASLSRIDFTRFRLSWFDETYEVKIEEVF